MAENFSDEQILEFKEAFSLFDKDGDGTIATKELGTVMRANGIRPTDSEIHDIINDVDSSGNGLLDFQDFLLMMSRRAKEINAAEEIKDALKVFDKDGKGKITATALKHILNQMGEKLEENEAENILKEADKNGDGIIDYEGFVAMMMS